MNSNIVRHPASISKPDRVKLKKHQSVCLWFTGLSGSGKSTLAAEVEKLLYAKKIHTYVLDGDNIRHGLNRDLGFGKLDRKENIRRVGEVAGLFVDAGLVVITAFISPFKEDRQFVRDLLPGNKFIEIFVDCDLNTCIKRDPKGLYKKAMKGELPDFTGISSPYEPPENPEIALKNDDGTNLNDNVNKVVEFLIIKNIIPE